MSGTTFAGAGIRRARRSRADGSQAAEMYPLNRAILDRWLGTRELGFHVHADVHVDAGGTQSYVS